MNKLSKPSKHDVIITSTSYKMWLWTVTCNCGFLEEHITGNFRAKKTATEHLAEVYSFSISQQGQDWVKSNGA